MKAATQESKFQPFFGQNAWNSGHKPREKKIENKPTNLNITSETNYIKRIVLEICRTL